jgi:hypothetical protein
MWSGGATRKMKLCAGAYRVHHQQVLVVLEHVERLHRHAGVAKADREVDLFFEHQVLRNLAPLVGAGLVVTDHQFDRLAQIAADFIDLLDGQLGTQAHAGAEIGRAAGQRRDQANANGLAGCQRGRGSAEQCRQNDKTGEFMHGCLRCPEPAWTQDEP